MYDTTPLYPTELCLPLQVGAEDHCDVYDGLGRLLFTVAYAPLAAQLCSIVNDVSRHADLVAMLERVYDRADMDITLSRAVKAMLDKVKS